MSGSGTVLRTQLAGTGRRPGRLLLTGAAMALAAFFAFGVILAQQLTERTLTAGFGGVPAAADLVVSGENGIDTSTDALAAVADLPGVAEAVGRVHSQYLLSDHLVLTVVADPGTGPLAQVEVTGGRYPAAPDELAIDEFTADRLDLAVGDVVPLRRDQGEPERSLRVVGLVATVADADRPAPGPIAYTTDAYAVGLAEEPFLQQIELRLAAAADPDTVLAAAEAALAADPSVVHPAQEARRLAAERELAPVQSLFSLLTMVVVVAAVAAVLVVTGAFRIVFTQRARQLALLRAIGAGRGALVRALLAEGFVTGLLAGGLGVLAAGGIGHALPPLLRSFGVGLSSPGLPVGAALAVVLAAAAVTTAATLAPALTAGRVPPVAALRSADAPTGERGPTRLRVAAGVLAVLAAAALAALVVVQLPRGGEGDYDPLGTLLTIVASATAAYVALVILGPVLVRPVLAVVGGPLRRSGPLGRLAAGSVAAVPRRAAAVGVVVALGVTLIAGGLIGSASLDRWLQQELFGYAPADFTVSPVTEERLPADFAARAAGAQGLVRTVPYRIVPADIQVDGQDAIVGLRLTDVPLSELAAWPELGATDGTLAAAGPGRVVLRQLVADITGLSAGDRLTVVDGDRSVDLEVAAVMGTTPLDVGALLDPADLDRLGVAAEPTGLLADAAGDRSEERIAGMRALQRLGAESGVEVAVAVLADERDQITGQIRGATAVMLAVLSLTVLVGLVGVGTTTALSVVERRRESGLLRAVGLSRRGLRRLLATESGLYGILGATLGLLLALPYAWLTVAALGQGMPVVFPVLPLAVVVAVLAAATAVVGLPAARRAARVSPVTALAAE